MVGESEEGDEYMSAVTLAVFEDSGWYQKKKHEYNVITIVNNNDKF